MVLDSKAMGWASENKLDTAALKKAKIPIYGKWYFPDLPAGVPLVNLQTGEVETFGSGLRAGAILYVKEEDLKRANLGPYTAPPAQPPKPEPVVDEPVAESAPALPVAGRPDAPERTSEAPRPPVADRPLPDPVVTAATEVRPSAAGTAAIGAETSVDMLHTAGDHPPSRPGAGPTDHGTREGQAIGHAAGHVDTQEHAHPGPRTYILVALILAVVTAVEVAVYYIEALAPFLVAILLVLSAAKFVTVVGYFMHLKFDHKAFLGVFAGGLAVAGSTVLAVIFLFKATPFGGGN